MCITFKIFKTLIKPDREKKKKRRKKSATQRTTISPELTNLVRSNLPTISITRTSEDVSDYSEMGDG